jgi:ferredoxin-NADP reductase
MAILRERAAARADIPTRLLASWRTIDDVIYRAELDALDGAGDGLRVVHTLTRAQPPDWAGYARRIDGPMLAEVRAPLGRDPLVYICGPTLLVEIAANGLLEGGVPAARVRTERFGPTG